MIDFRRFEFRGNVLVGRIIVAVFAGIVVLISIFFSNTFFRTDLEKVNLVGSVDNLPIETTVDAEILYSDSAKLKMKLTAPIMQRYVQKDPRIELPRGVNLVFYADSLQPQTTLKANYAVRYEDTKLMEAKGNVIVVNERGEQLNTEHLIWDEARRQIYTQDFVKITTDDEVIFGDGLESNEDFTKYKITNIKGTINLKEEADTLSTE